MTLQLVEKNPTPGKRAPPPSEDEGGRGIRLAPGAPRSPSKIPMELVPYLRTGEALVWWDIKEEIAFRRIGWVLLFCVAVLAFATLIVPGFWLQPFESLVRPLVAVFLAPIALLVREFLGMRSTLVTDSAVIDVTRRGRASRLAFSAVSRVRRDLLTGGIRLEGAKGKVTIPPDLTVNARKAIALQRRSRVRSGSTELDDPEGWLP
ncbi:MAG: hypothetical protein ACPG4T_10165 [Nannocystaceae bacterium]